MRKNNHIYLLLFFFWFLLPFHSHSQIDSVELLEAKVQYSTSDTMLLRLLDTLSLKMAKIDPIKGVGYSSDMLQLAKKMDDKSFMIRAYLNFGFNYQNIGHPDSSVKYIKLARQLSKEINTNLHDFTINNYLGIAYLDYPNFDSARYYFNIARDIATERQNEMGLAAVLHNLGLIDMDLADMQNAYENILEALKLFEKLDDKTAQGIALNNIGLINLGIGTPEKAIPYFEKAIELNVLLGDQINLSMNYSNLGVTYKMLDKFDKALEYYNKSIEIAEANNLQSDLARDYFNVANIYLLEFDTLNAQKNYMKSLEMSKALNVTVGVLYNNFQICELELGKGELLAAQERLNAILEAINETGLFKYKENYLLLSSRLSEKRKDYNAALMYYKKYKEFVDSIQVLANKDQINELQTKYETEKKSLENQQLKELNQLNNQIIQNQRLVGLGFIIALISLALLATNFFRSRQKLRRAFTVLKTLNKEVVHQKEKLEESNQTKDKMFSIIAHDLRSPFNSLMGFLEILSNDFENIPENEKLEMLTMVYNESVKTYGLLENLLQWSLMQRGLVEVSLDDQDIYNIVQSQIFGLISRAKSKNISINNNLKPLTVVRADENLLKTIFRNLINNSIKFTQHGGFISVDAENTDLGLVVSVKDNGIGMPQEIADMLFKNDIPDSRKGTDNEPGSGLGLRIVKESIEKLNATITVKSEVGKGSIFSISFLSGPVANA